MLTVSYLARSEAIVPSVFSTRFDAECLDDITTKLSLLEPTTSLPLPVRIPFPHPIPTPSPSLSHLQTSPLDINKIASRSLKLLLTVCCSARSDRFVLGSGRGERAGLVPDLLSPSPSLAKLVANPPFFFHPPCFAPPPPLPPAPLLSSSINTKKKKKKGQEEP